jgi:hypothetical protein
LTPTIKATADHLPGNSQRYGEWNDLPTYVVGNTQSDNEWNGQMDIHKPAHGIFLRAHPEITQRDVAEDCKSQQTDQGDVEFYVQKDSLENGGRPYRDSPFICEIK